MTDRVKLLLLTLAATLVVVIGAIGLASSPTLPDAGKLPPPAGCYYVISFTGYPHQVLYCPGGGGGAW